MGHVRAMNNLGLMFLEGDGVVKDPERAWFWLSRSAEKGYAKAQFNAGLMKRDGQGTERDVAEGLRLLISAAEQGYVRAESMLGIIYFTGDVVPKNYPKAVMWFERAAHSREFIRESAAQDLLFNHILPDIIITVHSYQYTRGQDNGAGV